jgi:hypothetical protein
MGMLQCPIYDSVVRGRLLTKTNPFLFSKRGPTEEKVKQNGLWSEQTYGNGSQRGPMPRVTVLPGCQQQASTFASAEKIIQKRC